MVENAQKGQSIRIWHEASKSWIDRKVVLVIRDLIIYRMDADDPDDLHYIHRAHAYTVGKELDGTDAG